jgi:hypothetical protein
MQEIQKTYGTAASNNKLDDDEVDMSDEEDY